MKAKRTSKAPAARVREVSDLSYGSETAASAEAMVRTQVYLTRREHAFLSREAGRNSETMAGIIRRFIDEKMEPEADAWKDNPLLEPPPADSAWKGHEDGARNHDHYIYGSPKRYRKIKGKWVERPLSGK